MNNSTNLYVFGSHKLGIILSLLLIIFSLSFNLGCKLSDDSINGVVSESSPEAPAPSSPSSSKDFVSKWRTTTDGESITLPLRAGYNYNFTVDWGDDSSSGVVTSDTDPDITHTYATAGDYTVTITGLAEAWYFNFSGDRLKLIEVSNFGDLGWRNLENAFSGCYNLISFAGGETASVTDMRDMFRMALGLTSLDVSSFNTANVTDMREMFSWNRDLTSLDLSSFDTANVTDMNGMFFYSNLLTSLDLSSFDTAKVTDMNGMFREASGLVSLDISSFDTANVTDMGLMFYNVSNVTSLDVSSFNTAKVIDMGSMFYNTSSLTSLDISSFNTADVTDMSRMFFLSSSLTSLDLSNFNTANVADMSWMFSNASGLTSLDLNNWDVSAPPTSTNIFNSMTGTILCDQDPGSGLGTIFGVACN